jgi:hypothetical protein
MAARRPRPEIRPRIVTDAQLANYLGKSVSWLGANRLKLERQGMPMRLPVVGGNDLNAVDDWLDKLNHQRDCAQRSFDVDELWQKATGNGSFAPS